MVHVFDEKTVARLKTLRVRLSALMSGGNGEGMRSRRAGGRFEFRDHRPYAAGDDVRAVDWNLYGRLDELFIKRFEGETRLDIHVVIDTSASMGVDGGKKDCLARRLAAAAAFCLPGEGRTLDVQVMSGELRSVATVTRAGPAAARCLPVLEGLPRPVGALVPDALRPLLGRGPRSRFILVISDFFDDPSPLPAWAGQCVAGNLLVLLGLTSHEERDPPLGARVRLQDAETGESLDISIDEEMRERYQELLADQRSELELQAARHGAAFVDASAEESFEEVFVRTLRRVGLAR
ncbi:MAG TPA: DUF58 domain-containing protein [Planctomycetes bacterium]|nr:DUF58 domain-containing protein [Planctomycetota bacterium]